MFSRTIIYIVSALVSALLPFLLMPILTRILSPDDYGSIAMYLIYTSAISALSGLSVHGAANRKFFDRGCSKLDLAEYNGNCIIIVLGASVFISIAILFLQLIFNLNSVLNLESKWLFLGIVQTFCSVIFQIRLGQWQIRNKAIKYAFMQCSSAALNVALSLSFVLMLNMGFEGRLIGLFLSVLIIGIASLISLLVSNLIVFSYNERHVRDILNFGLPLLPNVLFSYVVMYSDKFILNGYLSADILGIYMVAFSFAQALDMLFQSANKSYTVWLFDNLEANNLYNKLKIVKVVYLLFSVCCFGMLLAFLLSDYIIDIAVGDDFQSASSVLPYLILGQIFIGGYYILSGFSFYEKKTGLLSITGVAYGFSHIFLLFFLVPKYSMLGAGYAFAISSAIQFLLVLYVSVKITNLPWLKFSISANKRG